MTRYICPKCGQLFYYRIERCPHCNVKFKYHEPKKEVPVIEEKPVEKVKEEPVVVEAVPVEEAPKEEAVATPVEETPVVEAAPAPVVLPKSYFDGRLLQLIGYRILTFFLTLITLSLALPWTTCMMYRWEIKHTVIDDKRLTFDGRGSQLFGSYIKWLLLGIVTLSIYFLWLPIKITQWQTKHTHFKEEK